MAISELYAVTETVSTTEWSFTTDTAGPDADTSDGQIQGFFDVSALAAGDEFTFKIYEKATSGGTQRLAYQSTLVGAQSQPLFVTPCLFLLHGWDMTWIKVAGTDRSIVGSIRSLNSDDVAAVKADTAAILLDTAEIGAAGAGLTALASQTSVTAIDDLVDTEVAAIKTVVDAIKVKTDSLTFTVANTVDANVQTINEVAVVGAGTAADKWRA